MLEGIGSSIVGLFIGILGREPVKLATVPLLSWQEAEIFVLPTGPDSTVEAIVEQYLQNLSNRGIASNHQGVWIQSDWTMLAQHQGTVPASAASLTKIATTLAAIKKWGVEHRFETTLYSLGEIKDGVLQGDLLINGGDDPFFVWEEAISVGNALNELGIRQVTGNLIVTGKFNMNYKANPVLAGRLLRQGFDPRLWSPVVYQQYSTLPSDTHRPQVSISGTVAVSDRIPDPARLLLRHQSLTLAEILKQMNIYSNNEMAEMLAQSVGGPKAVAQLAAKAANVPPAEIQLVNGSGLGVDNRISPRAVCQMLIAIERHLETESMTITDLFPVAGRDRLGTMLNRDLPLGTTVKTGTLNQVSALAGIIPTTDGPIWFSIINGSGDILEFRAAQDQILQSLSHYWDLAPSSTIAAETSRSFLGDPRRIQSVREPGEKEAGEAGKLKTKN